MLFGDFFHLDFECVSRKRVSKRTVAMVEQDSPKGRHLLASSLGPGLGDGPGFSYPPRLPRLGGLDEMEHILERAYRLRLRVRRAMVVAAGCLSASTLEAVWW